MGGPTGVPQKPGTTSKDILIDFLAGGTGLFFSYYINKIISYRIFFLFYILAVCIL
jgi:hypothetical protein